MATNRTTGRGRRGAIRGRSQFRLPNGHYAKVDRTTGRILSVKADRKPYKGVVITPTPDRLPQRDGGRMTLPSLTARPPVRQVPSRVLRASSEGPTPFHGPAAAGSNDLAQAA